MLLVAMALKRHDSVCPSPPLAELQRMLALAMQQTAPFTAGAEHLLADQFVCKMENDFFLRSATQTKDR